jgi:hypothetical protein
MDGSGLQRCLNDGCVVKNKSRDIKDYKQKSSMKSGKQARNT